MSISLAQSNLHMHAVQQGRSSEKVHGRKRKAREPKGIHMVHSNAARCDQIRNERKREKNVQ